MNVEPEAEKEMADASNAADEIIDAFGQLHPHICMSWNEWADLREMICREFIGGDVGAADLIPVKPPQKRRRSP